MINGKKGNILTTFIIIVAIASIVGAFMFVLTARVRELPTKKAQAKAFYIAEAGINKAIWYVSTPIEDGGMGQGYRITASTETFGDGQYIYSVLDGPTTGSILIIATGEAFGVSKTIEQLLNSSASSTASFEFAVYSSSNLTMSGAGTINGPVFSAGNITLNGATNISGPVKILEGNYYKKNGVNQPATTVSTPPPMPTIDRSPYDELLSQAASQPAGNMSISGAGNYYLNGGTLYVNGNLNISGARSIRGGGTIVVTGNVNMSGSGIIDSNTKIIAGNNLSLSGSHVVNSNSVLFAGNNIDLSGAGDITGSVIAMNAVNASGAGRTIGLVYSQAGLSGARTIVGAIVCRSNAAFTGAVNITYNPSVISVSTIPGIISTTGITKSKGGWKEKK